MSQALPGTVIEEELEFLQQRLHESAEESAAEGGEEYRAWLEAKRGVFVLKVAEYLGLHTLACEVNRAWRREVFRGQTAPDAQKDADLRRLFATLLRVGEALRERAAYFTRHALPIGDDRHAALVRCSEDLRRQLADWTPPVLSLSPALRVQRFSPEAAARLLEILSGKDE